MHSERIVIVAYQPKPGKEDQLLALLKSHVPTLRKEDLVSERPVTLLRAKDGTYVEIFGWKSSQAIEAAHSNPVVQEMWSQFNAVCDYVPVGQLSESQSLFSEFEPVG